MTPSDLTRYQPLLQIVHVSDMHVISAKGGGEYGSRIRWIERWAHNLGQPALRDLVQDGIAPHDPDAAIALQDSLQDWFNDSPWSQVTNWLVVSGDQTTFGDRSSLDDARSLLTVPAHVEKIELYGNHDAWPGDIPLFARYKTHVIRSALRSHKFCVGGVLGPYVTPPSSSGPQIQLYGVDSVLHDRCRNTFAHGYIGKGRLNKLKNVVEINCNGPTLRILVTHHPIHYDPKPSIGMTLLFPQMVADRLNRTPRGGRGPLVHIVLSGHTHNIVPRQLSSSPKTCEHHPLAEDQIQLVVGSTLQYDPRGCLATEANRYCPQQFQVLRFFYKADRPGKVVMQRFVLGRKNGIGVFKVTMSSTGGESEITELPV